MGKLQLDRFQIQTLKDLLETAIEAMGDKDEEIAIKTHYLAIMEELKEALEDKG